MNGSNDLVALADYFGILRSFHDFDGNERLTSVDTMRALLAANGVDVSSDDAITQTLQRLRTEAEERWFPEEVIVAAFEQNAMDFGLAAAWEVTRWGCEALLAAGQAGDFITLPALDPDVYNLRIAVAGRVENTRVLATPKHLPRLNERLDNPRLWGVTAALYGLQSKRSGGVGDYADLATFVQTMGAVGAAFVGINPVHEIGFTDQISISPYSPSHRGHYNSNHIALDAIPGLENSEKATAVQAHYEDTFASIRAENLIDYAAQRHTHRACLEQLYAVFMSEAVPELHVARHAFEVENGESLQTFARFEALSEIFGADWREWPEDIVVNESVSKREAFHIWLQWVCDRQLAEAQETTKTAGMPLGLYLDLSVGARRGGAESWCEREAVATGVSVGAPPDQLGPDGQNWNLAAFSPNKLQATGYAPLRRVLAQTMRHAGVIRIDHVLGLNRSFWIPDDGSPGAYIQQPFEALVAIVKIEAWQNNTIVIGEDLGLVPDGFRDAMRWHGFYGYGVLQYEKEADGQFRDPASGPTQILSCFATHDTPTICGFGNARDIDWWEKLGSIDASRAMQLRALRAADVVALKRRSDQDSDLTRIVHTLLARSSAELVSVQFDDLVEEIEAQNLPGTIDEHPNWRRRYKLTLENLDNDTRLRYIAQIMIQAGRASPYASLSSRL